MSAKEDHYPDVEILPAETSYNTVYAVWRRITKSTNVEAMVIQMFSHPGAKRNAGVWAVGPEDQVRSFMDLHPVLSKDMAFETATIRERLW